MSSESEELSGGLDWSVGSYVFSKAFGDLAKALRWMFWGLLVQLIGAALAGAPLLTTFLRAGNPNLALMVPGVIALMIGGIVLVVGEQKCLQLELPMGMTHSLPGYNWLRAAYWCHLGSWLLRMARRFFDRRLVAAVLLPMQLLGFGVLLLFLRKTADVLSRQDLKRLVDGVFALASFTFFSGAFLAAEVFLKIGILRGMPRPMGLAFFGLPVVLFLITTGAYVILLGRMASAAADFANYLRECDEPTPGADELASA